jgi:hypothetical protein
LTICGIILIVLLKSGSKPIKHCPYQEWWRDWPCETTATDPPKPKGKGGCQVLIPAPEVFSEKDEDGASKDSDPSFQSIPSKPLLIVVRRGFFIRKGA